MNLQKCVDKRAYQFKISGIGPPVFKYRLSVPKISRYRAIYSIEHQIKTIPVLPSIFLFCFVIFGT